MTNTFRMIIIYYILFLIFLIFLNYENVVLLLFYLCNDHDIDKNIFSRLSFRSRIKRKMY